MRWQYKKRVYNALPLEHDAQKQKPSAFEKFFKKIGTDNLCGPLLRGFRRKSMRSCLNIRWRTYTSNFLKFKWRVWSWLRLNAGGRPNTCKSNGNSKIACYLSWRVADGWVKSGKLPDRGGQQLETAANTAYTLRGKGAIRYQMCPDGIS